MLKRCNKCRIEKSLKDFSRDKTKKDGYQPTCKECRKKYQRENHISISENGYKRTSEQRERMRSGHLGQEPWNKGLGGCKKGHDPSLYVCLPSGVYTCLGCKRENGAKYREKNRKDINFKNRISRYRITIEEFETLWIKQKGNCAICKEMLDKKKYRIDHNHTSGKVRGLLCTSCNTAIGLLQDSPKITSNAARYLEDARD